MRHPGLWTFLFLFAACSSGPRLHPQLGRCIWVDRWDYRSAADVDRVLDDCQRAGFSAVMFQVRGNGTVCYPSSLEPWSEHFGFADPGFDPLAVAVQSAHARGLQLHAWVNLLPGWVGVDPPADERQLWRRHREWFLQDRENGFQARAAGKYLTLNPCLPEVRRYLVDICSEIVARYEIDGLHLDYVRFPDPEPAAVGGLGTDPLTTTLFTSTTGKRRDDSAALHGWHVQCVSRLVADIRESVRAAGKPVLLSAAVFADQQAARDKVCQDWPSWCEQRLIDAVMPMNYTEDDWRFEQLARAAVDAAAGVPVVVGVGVYKHAGAQQSRAQFDAALAAGARGIGVFGYRALFGRSNEVPPDRQADLRHGVGEWLDAAVRRR